MNLLTPLLILGLVLVKTTAFDLCDNSNCSCKNATITCRCKKPSDTISIIKLDNDTIDNLEVTNCGVVSLWFNCFNGMNFKSIVLKDIAALKLDALSFLEMGSLESLLIENVEALLPKRFGMTIFRNTGKIILRNVSADTLPSEMFGAGDIKELHIINCYFKIIESSSFQMKSIKKILVADTYIRAMQTMAFRVDGPMEEVLFINSTIGYTESNSLFFPCVKDLRFTNCTFKELHSKFIKSRATNFYFKENDLSNCESNAFSYLSVNKTAEFVGNYFGRLETNGLPDFQLYPKPVVEANSFFCDCELSWLWMKKDEFIVPSSTCNNINGTAMKTLVPKIDGEGQCQDIVINESAKEFYHDSQSADEKEPFNNLWFLFIGIVCLASVVAVIFFVRKYKCQIVCRKTRSVPL